MSALQKRVHQISWVYSLYINTSGVQLIVHTTELDALAGVHSPVQVEYHLEYGRKDSRAPDPADREIQ